MIEVSGLSKIYGQRTAIENLNFQIQPGEIVGFLGPNGAGKSTTMKILTGVMPASSGTAKVAGFDVFFEAREVKRNIGYLPETPPVYFDMGVEPFLKYAASLHLVPSKKIKSAVDAVLEMTSLTNVRHRLIGNLSKGYRQRVGLAQAMVHDPKVLILDEPTVGLDPVQIIEVRELIKSLAGRRTVVFSSHILSEVMATCQRIIVINQGSIVAQDALNQQTSYILLAQQATEAGAEALRRVPGVRSITSQSEGTVSRLRIEVDPSRGELRQRLLATALEQNLGVLEFWTEQLSLEEVFLRLTSRGGRS